MKFSVLLSLDIELNDTQPREITEKLHSVIEQAVGEGRITGATNAELVDLGTEVNVLPADPSICPHCGSVEIEGGFVEISGFSAIQNCYCKDCGTAWLSTYSLLRTEQQESGLMKSANPLNGTEAKDADSVLRATVLDERFAHVVHADTPIDRYCDAVEVHGVRDCGDGTVELDEEAPTMYSSYVRFKIGGVACVGDHSTRALAERYAQEVAACYGLLPLGK